MLQLQLMRMGGLRAAAVLGLCSVAASAVAQVPTGGGILRDVERSVPTRPLTSPDGARIEVPDAPALGPDAASQRVTVSGFRIFGNTVFSQETLLAPIADRVGNRTVADLQAAADELTAYYRDRGYLLARAYLPQQEVSGGLITIAVLEGRYDKVESHSTARLSDARVLRTLTTPLCSRAEDCNGALITRGPLERGLLLLNDTPGAQAAARLSPGDVTGTSTLDMTVLADALASGYVQLDNGGSYYSGAARGIGTLWLNSPTGIGDQLTLQAVATAVHGNLYYGGLGYGVPLGYSGARLAMRGSYLRYELGDRYEDLDVHGTVRSADAALFYPFVRSLVANLSGSLTYGERRFHDEADAVGGDTERRISDRIEAGLNSDMRDHLFGAAALNTWLLLYTWGEVELDETLATFDALSARSAGSYGKWMAGYSRLQPLFGGSSLYVRVAAQGTSDNLDSYEKFALGGPDAVRAYPPSDTLVDESVLYSVEWRQRVAVSWLHALEAMVFYDHARGDFNASAWDAGARNRVKLSGVGVGLDCALTERTSLRSTLAWRGDRPMSAAPDSDYNYNLSLVMTF